MRFRGGLILLVASFLLLLAPSARAAGPITSGSTVSGSVAGPTFGESWTFSGTLGQRVIVTAVKTSGIMDTKITLKKPGGAVEYSTTADHVDVTLAATGTYTILIEDNGLNDAGGYNLTFLNLTAGPLTSAGDADGGAIASSEIRAGTDGAASDIDAFTFTGALNDRVLIECKANGGASYDTYVFLYPPNGGAAVAYTQYDRIDFKLTVAGTWTVVVEDNGDDATGNYNLTLLNVTSGPFTSAGDSDTGAIASNQIRNGTFQSALDFDAWTFSGTSGQRVIVIGQAAGAGSHDTQVSIYPPGGGPAVVATTSDRNEILLNATGTWTVVLEESGNDATGTYSLSFMNVTAGPFTSAGDTDGGPIASSEIRSGVDGVASDIDAFTFTGALNDRVLIECKATGGAGYDTYLFLYPPNGGAAVAYTQYDRIDFKLTVAGTWTVVVEDNGDDATGNYNLTLLNVTSGPFTSAGDSDTGAIASNQIKTGTFQAALDFDAWTISGTAGQRIIVIGQATGAGSHDTQISVYPPGGGPAVVATTSDRNEILLNATGTWTVVMEESGNDATGTYSLSFMNVTAGPFTSAGDTDGGPIASSEIRSGVDGVASDVDAFTFTGALDDRVLIECKATGGASYDTYVFLYPPNGGAAVAYTQYDRIDFKLTVAGTWTVVVEDNGDDATGNYSLTLLNVTSGPFTSAGDSDTGAIASNQIRTGTFQAALDFDAWTISGTAGQRIIVIGQATGAGSHDTQVSIYPPGGGPAVVATTSDRNEFLLNATGTWTVVMEEGGNDATGTYSLSFMNVTAGPFTSAGDTDGGPIASSEIKNGVDGVASDIDAFTFTGALNDRVLIECKATGGAGYDTYVFLYPPNGGAAVAYTQYDRIDFKLTVAGTWTVVVEDNGDDATGNYSLSLLNVTSGPFTSAGDSDTGAIASNQIKTGTFQAALDFDAWTFSGTSGQRIILIGQATGAGTHNSMLSLYPPGGGAAVIATASDRNEFTLNATGTWTVVLEESGNDATGTYSLSFMNVTAGPFTSAGDTDGGPIVSNDLKSGVQGAAGDIDAFTFTGALNDRVLISGLATGGSGYDTYLFLYPPNGGAAVAYTQYDRIDFKLTVAGTWTIVIEDNGDDASGSYNLCLLNVSSGPYTSGGETDGGVIVSGTPRNGSTNAIADLDGFTFYGQSGETASLTATATSGGIDTKISLYPPGGAAAIQATTADHISQLLSITGTYTVVVEDNGQDQVGNYTLSLSGIGGSTGVDENPAGLPDGRRALLLPATPSPFNRSTTLAFRLREDSAVRLRIFDSRGALRRTLVDATLSGGPHDVAWDGRDDRGVTVGNGVYYLQLLAAGEDIQRKVVRVQ